MWFFSKKFKVPISRHGDQISKRFSDAKLPRTDVWEFIRETFNAQREYNYREQQNYLVFKNEKDYMMFLLKL